MLKVLQARFRQGFRTGKFPAVPPNLPEHFRGRPEITPDRCSDCRSRICLSACPANAVQMAENGVTIDLGRCLFCGKCAAACESGAIRFTGEYRLGAMKRDSLICRPGAMPEPEQAENPELRRLCGRSLKIRQVSAGGCAACELDFNVLNTLAWDMGRFGIQVAASPRHADCLLITGPVTENMLLALKKTYAAVPRPAFVIACGSCAVSGGIYAGSPVVHNGVEDILPVDLYVPGCPPHPAVLLEALLYLMGRKRGPIA